MSLEPVPSPNLNLGPHAVSPHRGWGLVGQRSISPSLRELLPFLFLCLSHAHSCTIVHTQNGYLYYTSYWIVAIDVPAIYSKSWKNRFLLWVFFTQGFLFQKSTLHLLDLGKMIFFFQFWCLCFDMIALYKLFMLPGSKTTMTCWRIPGKQVMVFTLVGMVGLACGTVIRCFPLD